ncbi:MAG: adenylate/guanylate cyclase domain-containing protein [Deltaproteobacteria bacterium]|nr:adenylate/guanylate cyclase domain-containing protein [Deltaproteobacteria bacterium]
MSLETSEAEFNALRRVTAFSARVDEVLEEALISKASLEDVLAHVLPLLGEMGASAVAISTFDDSLAMKSFAWPTSSAPEAILSDPTAEKAHLEVAGQGFGELAARFPSEVTNAPAILAAFAEQLDDVLASRALAREKFQVHQAISDALKEPVLDDGLSAAIRLLAQKVRFDTLILVYRHEEDSRGVTLGYKIARGGVIVHDSQGPTDREVDAYVRAHAEAFLKGASEGIAERFGSPHVQGEALINGVRTERLIGRLLVGRAAGRFSTHDRDLLDIFADYVRMRVADFNREWKRLSTFFRPDDVRRLLHQPFYGEGLRPRVEEIAILYTDIASFTRIAEEVLVEPARIGALVDVWSQRSVEILWAQGGVFDKMVGDCVIGLFGPPFFDRPKAEICENALEAVRRIREYTATLSSDPRFPELHGREPLGVASGLNYCPVAVGLFGPSEDYTAFGSGMNNAARLQGAAKRGEILAMDSFVNVLGRPELFGEERHVAVKNVAKPLPFRALL